MDGTFDARAEAKKIEGAALSILKDHAKGFDTVYAQNELAKELASYWGDHNKRASVGAALQDDLKDKVLDMGALFHMATEGATEVAGVGYDDRNVVSSLDFTLYAGLVDSHATRLYVSCSDILEKPEVEVTARNDGFGGAQYDVTTVSASLPNGDDDRIGFWSR